MEKTTTRGGKRINAGRPKKYKERVKFQIMAYPDTIQAIKDFKVHCSEKDIDFVEALNNRILNALK